MRNSAEAASSIPILIGKVLRSETEFPGRVCQPLMQPALADLRKDDVSIKEIFMPIVLRLYLTAARYLEADSAEVG